MTILRTDRYVQLAIGAAEQAVEESGIKGNVVPERFSVLFGTGIGGINTFESEYRKLMEKEPAEFRRFSFPCLSPIWRPE